MCMWLMGMTCNLTLFVMHNESDGNGLTVFCQYIKQACAVIANQKRGIWFLTQSYPTQIWKQESESKR